MSSSQQKGLHTQLYEDGLLRRASWVPDKSNNLKGTLSITVRILTCGQSDEVYRKHSRPRR